MLRAWVTACSTGEEAYSLAIIFKEVIEKLKPNKNITLQIFATDLDPDSIEKARKAYFPKNIIADISPERISKFFITDDNGFKVNNSIREMVIFAPQNVVRDPPFTKLDIVLCRNMLIYMEQQLQSKLMTLFNYCLNDNGVMLLGTAESLGQKNDGFKVLDAKLKFFQRTEKISSPELFEFPSAFYHPQKKVTDSNLLPRAFENIQTLTDQILLQRFAPASVLTNNNGDIVYITGRTGKYLEPVAGKANMNIMAMAREGLCQVLPGAFRKVKQNSEPIVLQNIKVGTNGGTQYVDVTIQFLENPEPLRGMIMLVFNDLPPKREVKKHSKQGKIPSTQQIEFEIELQRSYEELQSTREEMQTSQEELKSTNEELQSTNEELQSTNEELTTSKEEMQSLNEELQTVNVELQSKITDFVMANNDMKNLLNSTQIAILFLDKDLNIRRYTSQMTDIIKLRSIDIGRPFTDLVSNLRYPEILDHARKVLKDLITIETVILTNDNYWFVVRMLPYRTLDDRIDGLVITFDNITELKKTSLQLGEALNLLHEKESSNLLETNYHKLFESAKEGILILEFETGKIKDVNPFLIEMLGYHKDELIGKTIWDISFFKDIVNNKEKFIELKEKEYLRYKNNPLVTAYGRKINVEFISSVYQINNTKVIQCLIRKNENADKI